MINDLYRQGRYEVSLNLIESVGNVISSNIR